MQREILCHATNLFFEARGESSLGQRWVLDVVTNRVNSPGWSSSYCKVITQRKQFSWYNDRQVEMPVDPIYWEEYIYDVYGDDMLEILAWHRVFEHAMNHYIYRDGGDVTGGSTHYMTKKVFAEKFFSVRWCNTIQSGEIDNHMFFKPYKERNGEPKCYRF